MAANSLDMTLVRQVLDLLATGIGPMETARQTGVSKTTVYKIHHSVGGVYRPQTVTYSKRYLDRDERYEIARLRDVGNTITDIAAMLGRSKSTVSRELDRNANPETGRYEPERAERLSWERQRRPKSSKLSQSEPLRQEVQEMLKKR
jgi:transposase, IS30 family